MEKISIREYARRLGISEKAVRKARDDKKIVNGIDRESGKIIYETANEEWGFLHLNNNVPAAIELTKEERKKLKIGTVLPGEEADMMPKVDDNFQKLQIKNLFFKTQIDILKKRQMEGELVSKAETDKKLFEAGKEIRLRFEALPDRCIDEIIANADDRNKAHAILLKNVKEILSEIIAQEKL